MKFSKFVCMSVFAVALSSNAFSADSGNFYLVPSAEVSVANILVDGNVTTEVTPASVSSTAASEVSFTVSSTGAWTATTAGCDDYKGDGTLTQSAAGGAGIAEAGAFNVQFVGAAAATTLDMATCVLTVALD